MENKSVPKFIFHLSRFPVYRGSVLGRFYCIKIDVGERVYSVAMSVSVVREARSSVSWTVVLPSGGVICLMK